MSSLGSRSLTALERSLTNSPGPALALTQTISPSSLQDMKQLLQALTATLPWRLGNKKKMAVEILFLKNQYKSILKNEIIKCLWEVIC